MTTHNAMRTDELTTTLTTLFRELVEGVPRDPSFMLNTGDVGLLGSLDKLSAGEASATHGRGSSIAAHVEHLRYGFELMNRWVAGESNPWKSADWTAAWKKPTVSDEEWRRLRGELRRETSAWLATLGTPRVVDATRLTYMLSTIPHLAYHLGAIRQMAPATYGPSADVELALRTSR
jgi:hypothetical protein